MPKKKPLTLPGLASARDRARQRWGLAPAGGAGPDSDPPPAPVTAPPPARLPPTPAPLRALLDDVEGWKEAA